jgi:hypothetical protein
VLFSFTRGSVGSFCLSAPKRLAILGRFCHISSATEVGPRNPKRTGMWPFTRSAVWANHTSERDSLAPRAKSIYDNGVTARHRVWLFSYFASSLSSCFRLPVWLRLGDSTNLLTCWWGTSLMPWTTSNLPFVLRALDKQPLRAQAKFQMWKVSITITFFAFAIVDRQ